MSLLVKIPVALAVLSPLFILFCWGCKKLKCCSQKDSEGSCCRSNQETSGCCQNEKKEVKGDKD